MIHTLLAALQRFYRIVWPEQPLAPDRCGRCNQQRRPGELRYFRGKWYDASCFKQAEREYQEHIDQQIERGQQHL